MNIELAKKKTEQNFPGLRGSTISKESRQQKLWACKNGTAVSRRQRSSTTADEKKSRLPVQPLSSPWPPGASSWPPEPWRACSGGWRTATLRSSSTLPSAYNFGTGNARWWVSPPKDWTPEVIKSFAKIYFRVTLQRLVLLFHVTLLNNKKVKIKKSFSERIF